MATVRHLGLFPFCVPINDNIVGGVEVSKEWACAYYWRIKAIKCTSLTFSASLTVSLPWGTDSVAFSATGGDGEIEAEKKYISGYVGSQPTFDEEKDERSLVCEAPFDGAVGFFSWQPVRVDPSDGRRRYSYWSLSGFVAAEYVDDEFTGNLIPTVINGGVHGSMSAATLTSYSFSSDTDERGPYGTNGSVVIPRLYRSFYRKSDNPDALYIRPFSLPNGSLGLGTYAVYGAGAYGFVSGEEFFQDKTGIQGGSVTFKINGFDDVVIPVYYYLESATGFVSYSATIEAAEFFPYAPNDGLGPIYDSTTGTQLRTFP